MGRREELADAAIVTLAREGMRGLTHRAVDREAGVSEGSTSYYFRTRQALLGAVVERATEMDTAELDVASFESLETAAAAIAEILGEWATTGRARQLARFELALEATRRPELRAPLVARQEVLRGVLRDRLALLGVADAAERAAELVPLLNGVLFDAVTRAEDEDEAVAMIRRNVPRLLEVVGS
ncbi:DNA-binding transcriptional regulator YbjK [Nocardioides luteus]|uniref:Transcriptional regulator, TetR family protein n=1 Tax=Nocardioides luteus TaxID=1844 RepID=A0ABQ5T0Z3_9ACTN|nr:TetR/AcrR family transcriptional regulator [Nocardioides luteus]MDR7311485.1 DNA-binding transcriptional regulator YbjK [Nocardioides luteus]GGR55306.1 putative transcriptional regulator, TetR family protein [Nocardioides luteus]GLJ70135.1 putative transcriptional regulator, TetR family protein [Nocardioides luteus]